MAAKQRIQNILAFEYDGYELEDIKEVTIMNTTSKGEFIVTDNDGGQYRTTDLYLRNEHNRQMFRRMKEIAKQKEELEIRVAEVEDDLDKTSKKLQRVEIKKIKIVKNMLG